MDRFFASNSVALSSAAQPARSACTSAGSAEQPVPDERGEEQPKKRYKHDHVVVSVDDVIIPKILQPIQTAVAQEIGTFKA